MRRCTGAPRCPFRLPASVFESDPLIYPATLFWRRFGCKGLVGGIPFSAKFICMGKWGVGTGFDSRPYKKCAHFAHFAENPCRVARYPRAQGHQPQGHPGPAQGRRDGRGAEGLRGTAYPAGDLGTGPTRHAAQTDPSTAAAHSVAPRGSRAKGTVFRRSCRPRLCRAHGEQAGKERFLATLWFGFEDG